MGTCCGAVDDEPGKSAGDGALKVTGTGGSDEVGSIGRGVIGTGTGGGEYGIRTPPAGITWDGCSFGARVRSLDRSSSTTSGG